MVVNVVGNAPAPSLLLLPEPLPPQPEPPLPPQPTLPLVLPEPLQPPPPPPDQRNNNAPGNLDQSKTRKLYIYFYISIYALSNEQFK